MSNEYLSSISKIALILDVSEITVRRRVRDNSFPHHRIGDRILFSQGDIEEIINLTAIPSSDTRTIEVKTILNGQK